MKTQTRKLLQITTLMDFANPYTLHVALHAEKITNGFGAVITMEYKKIF